MRLSADYFAGDLRKTSPTGRFALGRPGAGIGRPSLTGIFNSPMLRRATATKGRS